jgi:hypothetical protein
VQKKENPRTLKMRRNSLDGLTFEFDFFRLWLVAVIMLCKWLRVNIKRIADEREEGYSQIFIEVL